VVTVLFFPLVGEWSVALAQPPNRHRVVILSAPDTIDRADIVYEAIVFWNRTLEELKLSTRLTETTLTTTSDSSRVLENYTRQVWQQAGRLSPGGPGPKAPGELQQLDADVVVFLSEQPTMSFAWPLGQSTTFFVAVPARTFTPNIMAHELGHALGLTHHDDPRVLMCSPCQDAQVIDDGSFLPLTSGDRRRLQELHKPTP
jgi:hypothetical protein